MQLLLRHHKPYSPFPLCHYYKIDLKYIKPGVICPNCQFEQMRRKQYKWICPQCHHQDAKVHKEALRDYSLLVSNQITNQQAQEFLCLPNRLQIKRILQTSCFRKNGVTSQTVYQIVQ